MTKKSLEQLKDPKQYEQALLAAILNGNQGLADTLKSIGISLSPNSSLGREAVIAAISEHNAADLKSLIINAKISVQGTSSYDEVVEEDEVDVTVSELLSDTLTRGGSLREQRDLLTKLFYNPWARALESRDLKIIETLLKYGNIANQRVFHYEDNHEDGETKIASVMSHSIIGDEEFTNKVIDLLLQHDLDLDERGKASLSTLYRAFISGRHEYVHKLINKGACFNESDNLDILDINSLFAMNVLSKLLLSEDLNWMNNFQYKTIRTYLLSGVTIVKYEIMVSNLVHSLSTDSLIFNDKIYRLFEDYFEGNTLGNENKLLALAIPEPKKRLIIKVFNMFLSAYVLEKRLNDEALTLEEQKFFESEKFERELIQDRLISIFKLSNEDKTYSEFIEDLGLSEQELEIYVNLKQYRKKLSDSFLESSIPDFFGFRQVSKELLEALSEDNEDLTPEGILELLNQEPTPDNISNLQNLIDLYKEENYVENFLKRLVKDPNSLPLKPEEIVEFSNVVKDALKRFIDDPKNCLSKHYRSSIKAIINKLPEALEEVAELEVLTEAKLNISSDNDLIDLVVIGKRPLENTTSAAEDYGSDQEEASIPGDDGQSGGGGNPSKIAKRADHYQEENNAEVNINALALRETSKIVISNTYSSSLYNALIHNLEAKVELLKEIGEKSNLFSKIINALKASYSYLFEKVSFNFIIKTSIESNDNESMSVESQSKVLIKISNQDAAEVYEYIPEQKPVDLYALASKVGFLIGVCGYLAGSSPLFQDVSYQQFSGEDGFLSII